MLMTEPPPDLAIAGMPKRQPRKVPKRSSLIARQNSSSGASTAVLSAAVEPPAVLCRTCSPPNLAAAAVLAALFAVPALAQNQPQPEGTPTRIRGTVEKLDGKMLTVKTREGQTATITLADNFTVSALAKKTVGDLKSNDYIASTGIKGTDGKLHCVELRIFPEAQRGLAEGQFPWDSRP